MERDNNSLDSIETDEKLARYTEQLSEMQATQKRQLKMFDVVMKQRDMYQKMYKQALNQNSSEKQLKNSSKTEEIIFEKKIISDKLFSKNENKIKELENKLSESEFKFNKISEEYIIYINKMEINKKLLDDEIERLKNEAEIKSTRCSHLEARLNSSQKNFDLLQTNISTFKSEIKILQERCANYCKTIEVQLEYIKQEREHFQNHEILLKKEKDMLLREKQIQSILQADVQSIKAYLEKQQTEGQRHTELRLNEANKECADLRKNLQEEQEKSKESICQLEKQLSSALENLAEEQALGECVRIELEETKTIKINFERKIEELEGKLKQNIVSLRAKSLIGDENLGKCLHELEMQLASANDEIKSSSEQLKAERQQNQLYSDIIDKTEQQLEELNVEYEKYRREMEIALEISRNETNNFEKQVELLEGELKKSQNDQQIVDKEFCNKLSEEKMKLEKQIVQLNQQIQIHGEQTSKINEEVRKLGQDLNETLADSSSKSDDLETLRKELDSKEAVLNYVKNKEIQIRKIAKKYKIQYEELANRKPEEGTSAQNPEDNQISQEREEQLREEGREEIRQKNIELEAKIEELTATIINLQEEPDNLKRQIENLNEISTKKEERTAMLLKGAKTRIIKLTEAKTAYERELNIFKSKINVNDDKTVKLQSEVKSSDEKINKEPMIVNIKPMVPGLGKTQLANVKILAVQSRGSPISLTEKPCGYQPGTIISVSAGSTQQQVQNLQQLPRTVTLVNPKIGKKIVQQIQRIGSVDQQKTISSNSTRSVNNLQNSGAQKRPVTVEQDVFDIEELEENDSKTDRPTLILKKIKTVKTSKYSNC